MPIASLLLEYTYGVSDEGRARTLVHEPHCQHFSGGILRGLEGCVLTMLTEGQKIDDHPKPLGLVAEQCL